MTLNAMAGSGPWKVRQADLALPVYFVNFLKRPTGKDDRRRVGDPPDATNPLTAL